MKNMIKTNEFHIGPLAKGGDSPLKAAWRDFWGGIKLYPIWSMLAWQDIRQRYRRSVLGPFWLTISAGVMVGALGVLYAGLLHQELSSYLPFLAIGLILWGLISTILGDACTVFISAEGLIKQLRLPLTVYVCRMVWRNLIVFAHSVIVIVIVMVWAQLPLTIDILLIPLAILFYCLVAMSLGLLLGILCTRYRDLPPLIGNLIQLVFFVSPIMWSPKILIGKGENLSWVADFNPVYYFIEIIRAPLMGELLPADSWLIVVSSTCVLWLLAMWTLVKFRHRVAYWL